LPDQIALPVPALGKNCYIPVMTMTTRVLAEGPGWTVSDVLCGAGPADAPFEEQHDRSSIALVLQGAFRYETGSGHADLVAGSLLLGNRGECFQCGHEHSWGDRCISFHFASETLELVASEIRGVRTTRFPRAGIPPLEPFIPLFARGATLNAETEDAEFEELAFQVVEAGFASLHQSVPEKPSPTDRDRRRVAEAVRRIERNFDSAITLASLAAEAGVSAFHFLRTFRALTGTTPHQFLLLARLHRAAKELRQTDKSVSAIAFDAGFGDLSTFNRRFRRLMGVKPTVWRARA
jgi:AraC family transcriptional regulator